MKYIVVVCGTDSNCITNEGVFDTLASAKKRLKDLELHFTGLWSDYADVIPHHEDGGDTSFDLELSGPGYELYGQILEVE